MYRPVYLVGVALLAVFASRRALSGGESACATSESVRAEIASAERTWNIDTDPTGRRKLEALRALVEQAPADVEAHLAYQEIATQGQRGLEAGREEYRKLHEQAPGSPLHTFLYARLLPPKEAELFASDLTQNHPEFPWGHLLAASMENGKGTRRDEAALSQHLTRFRALCPDSPASYRLVSTLSDPEFLQASARSLRALLEWDEKLAKHFPTLWSLEFKSVPIADHPKIRERVRRDLARLVPRLVNDPDTSSFVVFPGFDLLEDVEGRRRTEDAILEANPGSFYALRIVQQRFGRRNPWPKSSDPEPKRAAYFRTLFDASTGWISRWRDYPDAWVDRLAAVRELEDVSDEDAIRTGEELLEAVRKRPREAFDRSYPTPIRIAELWLSRGIRLQEVIHLADAAVTDSEQQLWTSALFDAEGLKETLEEVRWLTQALRAEANALLGRLDEARRILTEMEAAKPVSAQGADVGERLRGISHAVLIERTRAGLCVADGRATEALAIYRKAASLFPAEWRDQPVASETVRRVRLLYRRERGTLDGFDAWLAKGETVAPGAPASLGFEKRSRKLADFRLTGVDGKLWRLADLKGKRVFVNVWATWCGPCLSELPYIQALHERLRKRRDLLLLTFTIDENIGLIAPFLKREKYSFPALLAKDYVGDVSVPRNWIISKEGVLELEGQGSPGESVAAWAQKVERLLDSLGAR